MTRTDRGPGAVALWRDQLVRGAAIWSGRGRPVLADGRYDALSGVGGTDGNVIFCFSGEADAVRGTAAALRRSPVPAVALVGAEALGWAQILVDAGLACVGGVAFMHLPADRADPAWRDAGVHRLGSGDLAEARLIVRAAYAEGSPMSAIALPAEIATSPDWAAWGLTVSGALVSVVTTTVLGDIAGIWSMSTPRALQRRGHGRRLLSAVISELVDTGTRKVLLYASPQGEPLYRSLGFEVVEHWQGWSRPRWVLGRS